MIDEVAYDCFCHKKRALKPFLNLAFYVPDYSTDVVSVSTDVVSIAGASSSSMGVTVSSCTGSSVVSASLVEPPPQAMKADAKQATNRSANSFFIVDRFLRKIPTNIV